MVGLDTLGGSEAGAGKNAPMGAMAGSAASEQFFLETDVVSCFVCVGSVVARFLGPRRASLIRSSSQFVDQPSPIFTKKHRHQGFDHSCLQSRPRYVRFNFLNTARSGRIPKN